MKSSYLILSFLLILTSTATAQPPRAFNYQAVARDASGELIINYWPEAEYMDPGHVPGAIQYTPKESLLLDNQLKTLPADRTIAIYGYSGLVSASVASYLRLLGYDAKWVQFGTNGMIYDEMTKGQWSPGAIMNYEYVTD